jgi:F-type H+-transporting ATPase subunit b
MKLLIQKDNDEINKQKAVDIAELKGQVDSISVNIAEKLINNQLSNSQEQQAIIAQQVNQLNNNQAVA